MTCLETMRSTISINCKKVLYNRRLRNEEFLQLWNTAMLKQPFYKDTYFIVKNKSETAL